MVILVNSFRTSSTSIEPHEAGCRFQEDIYVYGAKTVNDAMAEASAIGLRVEAFGAEALVDWKAAFEHAGLATDLPVPRAGLVHPELASRFRECVYVGIRSATSLLSPALGSNETECLSVHVDVEEVDLSIGEDFPDHGNAPSFVGFQLFSAPAEEWKLARLVRVFAADWQSASRAFAADAQRYASEIDNRFLGLSNIEGMSGGIPDGSEIACVYLRMSPKAAQEYTSSFAMLR